MGGGNQYVQKYEFYMTFVKVYIYPPLFKTVCPIFTGIQSLTSAAKNVDCRGARFENSRDMPIPRYRSYRNTVGTEYTTLSLSPFKR